MKNNKVGTLTLPDSKTFYKTATIKTMQWWESMDKQPSETDSHIQTDQRNRTGSPKTDSRLSHLQISFLTEETTQSNGTKMVFSKLCWVDWTFIWEKINPPHIIYKSQFQVD